MSKAKFKGILAVGRTAEDARNQYKLLAIGKGATVQMGGGNCFVTHSSGENMFNPLTGDMDLEVNASFMDNLQFQANASDVPDSAYHFKCHSGCGAHIVTDMSEISYCPNCTSEAVEAADDGSDEDAASDADAASDEDAASDAGSDIDTGSDAGSDEGSDAGSEADAGSDGDLAVVSGNTEDDMIAVVASSLEEAQRIYQANKIGVAEAGEDAQVEYVVCSNAECGGHIISDKVMHQCPACNSDVMEPAVAGEDDDEDSDAGDESSSDADVHSDEEADATGSDADEGSDAASVSDEDAASDADAGSDEAASDAGSDEAAEASDDSELAVVAASRSEAEQMFAEQMIGKVEAGAESAEAHYVVCSSADCGAHIIGTAALEECPVCHSSTEEPEEGSDEGAGPESDLDAGSDEAAEASGSDESDTESLNLTDGEGNTLDENTSDVDATAVIDDSAEAKDLDVSYSTVQGEGTWTAFYKGTPVALAKRTDAGKNADVFDKPAFGQVLLATAGHSDIKTALSELGFKPIMHKVSVSAEVQRMVDERANEAIAAAEESAKQFKDSFLAALATAAAGINRNFFKDVAANPLKGGLWTTLSSVGMQNPEVLIDKAFAAHADEYHKILVAKACEILEQPSEVQASLASAVQNSNYQAVASGGGNLEDRLAGLGTVVASESKLAAEEQNFEATAGADDVLHQAVRTLGRR